MPRTLSGPPSDAVIDALPPTELLQLLSPEVREELTEQLTWISLHAGEVLFEQDQPGDALYRLLSGRLEVHHRNRKGRVKKVDEIVPGEWTGDLALLTGGVRRATVIARRDSILGRIDATAFRRLAARQPEVMTSLARFAVQRLAGPRRQHAQNTVVAILPASRGVAGRAFAEALKEQLSRYGIVRVVTPREAERAMADGPEGEERVDAWLDELEAQSRFLLLVADRQGAWADTAERNADRVLLVAPVSGTPAPVGRVQREQRRDLVLLHAEYTRVPRGTARWLDRFEVDRHHHVRLGQEADVARVARFLANKAVGLALAGGAGRGTAHLGVIQALEESGIPVDVITGTSMGAILGALRAQGRPALDIIERARETWTGIRMDLAFPLVALTRGRALKRAIRRSLGSVEIEDLWLPFACVSTSLGRAEKHIHRRGNVVEAVLASSSLPGLVPPVRKGDDLLVDGAFVDNLPDELARELGAGTVIAVNVMPTIDPIFVRARKRSLAQQARRLNPFSPERQPMLHDIVTRAYFVPTVLATDAVRGRADLFIEPPLSAFSPADRSKSTFDAIHAAGYHETLRVLRELKARGEPWPGL